MNDANAEMLDSDLLADAESTSQHASLAPLAGDELKTTRLPPITPPPPPLTAQFVTTSLPPLASAFPLPSAPPLNHEATTRYRAEAPPAPSVPNRPSWLRGLLATTFPPPAAPAALPGAHAQQTVRRAAGAACIGLALVFALVAMLSAFRGAPADHTLAPIVAASLVLMHALIALGAGTFSFCLLRMAERLLEGTPGAPRGRTD